MRAFRRGPPRIAPPDLAKARHFVDKNLLALIIIEVIEEPVLVELVGDFAHDAIEHQEAIDAAPVEDAVIFDD